MLLDKINNFHRFSKGVFRSAAVWSPENLLEMPSPRSYLSSGWGPAIYVVTSPAVTVVLIKVLEASMWSKSVCHLDENNSSKNKDTCIQKMST